ncbi:MAG: 2-isopropylmalate synthase [Thermoanaerobaculum sp.]
MEQPSPLVFAWDEPRGGRQVLVDDETLRDGLQSPSVREPSLEAKKEILHILGQLGVRGVDLGMPAASPRVEAEVTALLSEIRDTRLPLVPNCAVRALERDILTLARISQEVGHPLEAMLFLSFSALRRTVEGWGRGFLLHKLEQVVTLARREGLAVTFVAEDASRTAPEDLEAVFLCACHAGASRVCLADTTGCLGPAGAWRIANFARTLLNRHGFASVGLDWHGHNDRGLAVACALAAATAGADRLHGTLLGVGERTGNAPTELLLLNLWLEGWQPGGVQGLRPAVQRVAELLAVPVPANAPVVGNDAFRTGTGVHAAAILKAREAGRRDLEELVYSPFPPSAVGGTVEVSIGPYSGAANVRAWLAARGLPLGPETVAKVLKKAKAKSEPLSDGEIWALLGEAPGPIGTLRGESRLEAGDTEPRR